MGLKSLILVCQYVLHGYNTHADGGMLEPSWEAYAVRIGNATADGIESIFTEIVREANINLDNGIHFDNLLRITCHRCDDFYRS